MVAIKPTASSHSAMLRGSRCVEKILRILGKSLKDQVWRLRRSVDSSTKPSRNHLYEGVLFGLCGQLVGEAS